MRKGRIEDWQEFNFFGQTRIAGRIYGCDKFEDGEEMFTNEVVKYHTIMGQLVVETKSGSMYHLGKPAESERTLADMVKDYQAVKH